MAQPKNRKRRDEDPKKSAERKELENLQKKSEMFVQKRNELNDQARLAREERDLLHDKRKEAMDKIGSVKAERDAFNAKLREHKEKRNEYQRQAKLLIAKRRGEGKKVPPSSPVFRVKELESEIRDLEFQQETTVLTTKQENKLIDGIRRKRLEYQALQREASKYQQLRFELKDKDSAIDQLFALADAEHQEVVKYYKQAQEAHERFMKVFEEASKVIGLANAKHAEYLDLRKRADEQHQEFLALREKILDLRGKEYAERTEARTIIREQRAKVREAVADPKKLDEVAESTLEQLKKGGKIQLG